MYKILDYNTGEDLFKDCRIVELTLNNEILSAELSILLPSLNITVINDSQTYDFYTKNKKRRAVKVVAGEVFVFDGILEPINNLYISGGSAVLEIKSPLTLLSLESEKIIWDGFLKEFLSTNIFDGTSESIISLIVENVNNLLPQDLRILKVNNSLSEILEDNTTTFLIKENTNILELLSRLLYEFSLYIFWQDGIVIKRIKPNFNLNYLEKVNCVGIDNFQIERVNPIKNRLVIVLTDKKYKTILEAIEEDIKGVWNEIGTRDESNLSNPVKPLFENQYYPENSVEYEERKYITKGFLVDFLYDNQKDNKVLLVSKDLNTEISPILLIEDPLILFNPYNEWFKKVATSKDIKSKGDLINELKISPNSKAYQMLEKYYKTDTSNWEINSKTKSYLMLREFKSGADWISYSFWHQPKNPWDITKPAIININWIQVIASAHYRNIEYTLRGGEKYFTREELKDLYLYINTIERVKEEYRFKQHILLNGYETIKFQSPNRLEITKNYNIFNPRGEGFILWLISETINISSSGLTTYSYIGYLVFDITKIPEYPVIINSKSLDIGRRSDPLFLKTHWDTQLKTTIYEHWFIDDVPAIAFERVKSAAIGLYGFLTFYVINRLPEEAEIQWQAYGDPKDLIFLAPKNEIQKVKDYYKKEFGAEVEVQAITGVEYKKLNEKIIICGNWKGQDIGGSTYKGLPYRENFVELLP